VKPVDLIKTDLESAFASRELTEQFVDEFEANWHIGKIGEIEDFVRCAPEPLRSEVLTELVIVDIEHARARSHNTQRTIDAYHDHFNEFATLFQKLKSSIIESIQSEIPLEPGQILAARFELREFIGSGAMGEVWRAMDLHLRRNVAIKIVNRRRFSENEMRRFLREAQAGAQLCHPNIVQVHDTGQQGFITYLVADFVEGQNLKAWLRDNGTSYARFAAICRDVALALECAHEHGIIHRDVKPANILIDKRETVFVTDFGLAKWNDDNTDLTQSGQLLGTAGYMSPEQVRGQSTLVDARADVYALGATLYELLVGHRPHEGELLTVINEILHVRPLAPRKIRQDIPKPLETICLKCLEKDRRHRYQTCRDVADDLNNFLARKPIRAKRKSLAAISVNWLKTHKTSVALLSLCVSLALAMTLLQRLEKQNDGLRGIQNVSISTDPQGARLAFVPIKSSARETDPKSKILAKGETPLEMELPSGDYMICAVLPDGRFHEVYRHIPRSSEDGTTHEVYPHRRSKRTDDGIIMLPTIEIPDMSVIDSMVLLKGTDNFTAGERGSSVLPQHRQNVASYFMDPREFSLGDLKAISDRLPPRFNKTDLVDEQPISVSLDQAIAYAEAAGKRLPTEFEYEYASTNLGKSRFPWGDWEPSDHQKSDLHSDSPAIFDRLNHSKQILGLCTGIAEWTSSPYVPYPPYSIDAETVATKDVFVVRGSYPHKSDGGQSIENLDPRQRHGINRHIIDSEVGFRCVRSADPILTFEKFDD
jgi:eukaryotic-like serine/threonine-protein kinase